MSVLTWWGWPRRLLAMKSPGFAFFGLALKLSSFASLAIVALGVAQVHAQSYPSRPVTIIVPQGAGGANDVVARIVGQRLAANLGQPFVIENHPGAGGTIGTQVAARAHKDGYTILLTVSSAHVIGPHLYKSPGFDPIKDFDPVTSVATVPYMLVAHPSFPASTVNELIELARSRPKPIQYASAGNGTMNHLLAEMLKTRTNIELVHVPYKSSTAAVIDVAAGQVPIAFQSIPSAIAMVKAAKLKVLAVATPNRVPSLPDVPTIGESVDEYGESNWYGVFLPAGTPSSIRNKLYDEIVKVLDAPDVKEKLAAQGGEPLSPPPEQFADLVSQELTRWEALIKRTGARVD